MTDDRSAFTEARDAGKAIHQAQRLENATYTAVEVKALTKTASDFAYALGRKEARGEIAVIHSHPPRCCCPTDTCTVCGGTDVAAPGVGCIDSWHDEPPLIEEVCPACPDHGRDR